MAWLVAAALALGGIVPLSRFTTASWSSPQSDLLVSDQIDLIIDGSLPRDFRRIADRGQEFLDVKGL